MRLACHLWGFLFLLIVPSLGLAQTTYYPATGIFNGFLNQLNIVECDNNNNEAVGMSITVTSSIGDVLGQRFLTLPAFGSVHTILNGDLADITDNIGTYLLEIAEGQAFLGDKISCRTAIYRSSSNGQKQFDYAYVLPVQNPQFGSIGGLFDSRSRSNSGVPTANWLSIVNFDTEKSLEGNLLIYNEEGEIIGGQTIEPLARGERVDIPLGHPDGEVAGTYLIVPDDKTLLYDAFLLRYNQDAAGNYNYAFPLRALAGACAGEPILASSMGNGLTKNYLEVSNVGDLDIDVTIEVRDRFGGLLFTEVRPLTAHSQTSLNLSPIIDPEGTGNVGSARVVCEDLSDRLAVQSTFYGHISSEEDVEWAYSTQARGFSTVRAGAQLSVPFNTFLGMYNWLKISDASLSETTVEFEAFDFTGNLVASGENNLAAGGTIDQGVHEFAGADNVGSLVSTPVESSASFSGEVLRVSARSDGDIGTIIQIPGIIQQAGVSSVGGVGFLGDPQSLTKYRENLTREEAKHLLTRIAFGGSWDEVNAVLEEGLSKTVEKYLAFDPDITALQASCEHHIRGLYNVRLSDVQLQLTCMMKENPNRLQEKLAFMWHDHFATSCLPFDGAHWKIYACRTHMNLFRTHAKGNFGDLFRAVSFDPLMLEWLNGNLNYKDAPDENYAREFHELFGTGESGTHNGRFPLYTEADIAESARIFTGWVYGRNVHDARARFEPSRHDTGVKTLYRNTPWEVSGAFNAEDLHDIILARNDTARYIGERLFVTFCHHSPSEALSNLLGDMVFNANYEVAEILKTILRSEACFSQDARNSRVKDPVHYLFGFVKQTGFPVSTSLLRSLTRDMGLEITNPPTVFGWPMNRKGKAAETDEYFAWAPQYGNAIVTLVNDLENFEGGVGMPADGYYLNKLLEPIGVAFPGPSQVVDQLADVLDITLGNADRDLYIQYLETTIVGGEVEPDPFDPQNIAQVRTKMAGLLWLMSQHEQYMTY